ncbi:MAG: phosphatidylserine/phosphatidylglycerophosphate/cardiolipin synthase family protein, partial [Bacteroidales bacterium]
MRPYSNTLAPRLYDDNLLLFTAMIDDILNAKHSIYLETYRFAEDAIGKRFREALLRKCKEGLTVRLLLDAYGTNVYEGFFNELIEAGAQVRYFKKLKFFISNIFDKNHTRNHQKLLLIDGKISYVGSSNLSAYSLSWRELNLRLEGDLCLCLTKAFNQSFQLYKLYDSVPFERIENLHSEGFTIIQDTPSVYFQKIRSQAMNMIGHAKHEIRLETPYFLPSSKFRKALIMAAQRGVKVIVYIPFNSDMRTIDLLRNKYLGPLYKAGIEWRFYKPDNLHAKCLLCDNKYFMIGSSNFDYRSFRYQYEIMLCGEHKEIITLLDAH